MKLGAWWWPFGAACGGGLGALAGAGEPVAIGAFAGFCMAWFPWASELTLEDP